MVEAAKSLFGHQHSFESEFALTLALALALLRRAKQRISKMSADGRRFPLVQGWAVSNSVRLDFPGNPHQRSQPIDMQILHALVLHVGGNPNPRQGASLDPSNF